MAQIKSDNNSSNNARTHSNSMSSNNYLSLSSSMNSFDDDDDLDDDFHDVYSKLSSVHLPFSQPINITPNNHISDSAAFSSHSRASNPSNDPHHRAVSFDSSVHSPLSPSSNFKRTISVPALASQANSTNILYSTSAPASPSVLSISNSISTATSINSAGASRESWLYFIQCLLFDLAKKMNQPVPSVETREFVVYQENLALAKSFYQRRIEHLQHKLLRRAKIVSDQLYSTCFSVCGAFRMELESQNFAGAQNSAPSQLSSSPSAAISLNLPTTKSTFVRSGSSNSLLKTSQTQPVVINRPVNSASPSLTRSPSLSSNNLPQQNSAAKDSSPGLSGLNNASHSPSPQPPSSVEPPSPPQLALSLLNSSAGHNSPRNSVNLHNSVSTLVNICSILVYPWPSSARPHIQPLPSRHLVPSTLLMSLDSLLNLSNFLSLTKKTLLECVQQLQVSLKQQQLLQKHEPVTVSTQTLPNSEISVHITARSSPLLVYSMNSPSNSPLFRARGSSEAQISPRSSTNLSLSRSTNPSNSFSSSQLASLHNSNSTTIGNGIILPFGMLVSDISNSSALNALETKLNQLESDVKLLINQLENKIQLTHSHFSRNSVATPTRPLTNSLSASPPTPIIVSSGLSINNTTVLSGHSSNTNNIGPSSRVGSSSSLHIYENYIQ
jgi:hypothetical protein